jgi:hypothetical protein
MTINKLILGSTFFKISSELNDIFKSWFTDTTDPQKKSLILAAADLLRTDDAYGLQAYLRNLSRFESNRDAAQYEYTSRIKAAQKELAQLGVMDSAQREEVKAWINLNRQMLVHLIKYYEPEEKAFAPVLRPAMHALDAVLGDWEKSEPRQTWYRQQSELQRARDSVWEASELKRKNAIAQKRKGVSDLKASARAKLAKGQSNPAPERITPPSTSAIPAQVPPAPAQPPAGYAGITL